MITHRSCLEALAVPHAADAFDFLADLWLWPYNTNQRQDRIGVSHHLQIWFDYAEDLNRMMMSNYKLPKGWETDDGRIAGVTERAVQETMDL